VTVKPTARTGLAAADVFYYGNLVGDTGARAPATSVVNALDLVLLRARPYDRDVPVTDGCDFNRDGFVNARDLGILRGNLGAHLDLTIADVDLIGPRLSFQARTDSPARVAQGVLR
jgi:hypothetical protein